VTAKSVLMRRQDGGACSHLLRHWQKFKIRLWKTLPPWSEKWI